MPNPAVDAFVDNLAIPWQREQCREILRITRESSPPLEESIKWGHPYFEHRGAVVKWFCAKEWINIYFFKGHMLSDPDGYFEPTDNSKMRTIKVRADQSIRGEALAELLESAIKLNTA